MEIGDATTTPILAAFADGLDNPAGGLLEGGEKRETLPRVIRIGLCVSGLNLGVGF